MMNTPNTASASVAARPAFPALADVTRLRSEFHRVKTERNLRDRDAAAALGVSEGETVAAFVGEHVVRLRPEFIEIVEALPALGRVMALTRNNAAVHEKDGQYEKLSHTGTIGLGLGKDLDLRLFYHQWAYGYAVETPTESGPRRSLQFFDKTGTAVHKMFLRNHSDVAAYDALVARFRASDQTPGQHVVAADAPKAETPDADIDTAAFQRDWLAMTDTHQFFELLKRHRVSRAQALRLAPDGHAQRVGAASMRTLLDDAAGTAVPIMVFVGNAGMIQIHTGPVKTVRVMGPWVNVLDPDFNLHLREDLIDSAWMVRKPTADGIVSSLELLDASGMVIAMVFGERKPGQAERDDWRETLARVAQASHTNDAQGVVEAST
ncbi:Hemin transport protein HemS [Pandoraea eparura]|jgi:putative hemin transport protein|uniref:Hemin transport protein HemS n=1 Tax=Pandoraea eparura TaxID=2508291 RepID=A0A5E4YL47_9BURK|nr:ChuX/HutX family heme-like substrate-binding protein [Pandoraea eparura]VVE49028.1 Hemin transport protein HemS [Pandoraea eparura]